MESPQAQYEAFAQVALPEYGFSPDARVRLLNLSENGTFLVQEADRRAVLRVHRDGYHSRQAIESELNWLEALRSEAGVRTPETLRAVDGRRVVDLRVGDRYRHGVLFEWLPGVEPPTDDLVTQFEVLGGITARMHLHTRSWRRPADFTRFSWDDETTLGATPHWGRWQDGMAIGAAEQRILSAAADLVLRRLAAFGKGPDRFGLVHADMRLANLLLDGDQVYVIDFDDCGFSWYLYDLATAVSFIEDDPRVPEWTDAWVRGYRRVCDLSSADEQEIGTFIMLRRLLLVAWIGSHSTTDLAQEMGAEFTRVSCDLAEQYLSTTPHP
ncbi:phosphotransferase [Planosporangium flavigriseum]|uniref:Aminoglycoside phosphotransferase n=1 Tax=Planosporangium flavigriseum TaxID=373681 RepID=A0A8J3LPJ3_9ACTN|nr:phosphotransferase [Planosporangium flavigriseum]NJC66159.1 phosphotransferase [Planosporangium flavigriseum]GIG75149.1 aminoglycoside phosphotransferase [Planosporangium flavigriseum]